MRKRHKSLSREEKYQMLKDIIAEAKKVIALNGGKDIAFVEAIDPDPED